MHNKIQTLIGQRIKAAREEKHLTQQELAARVGIPQHQIISSIEKGERKVSSEELLTFMNVLGQGLDYFTNPFLITEKNIFCWRTSKEVSITTQEKMKDLISLYRTSVILNEEETTPFLIKPRYPYWDFKVAAEFGETVGKYLNLSDIPTSNLVKQIQEKLKVKILYIDSGEEFSGAAFNAADFPCILVNFQEVEWRQNFDIVHELFHLLTWDVYKPLEIDKENGKRNKKEKFADTFASALLMPKNSLLPFWNNQSANNSLTDKLLTTARNFKVSPEAVFWRLCFLDCLRKEQYEECSLSSHESSYKLLYSHHFAETLRNCLVKGKISLRKVCNQLRCTQDDLDNLFTSYSLQRLFTEG